MIFEGGILGGILGGMCHFWGDPYLNSTTIPFDICVEAGYGDCLYQCESILVFTTT